MRLIALSTLTVAFFASAQARFGIGSCPKDKVEKYTYADYRNRVAFPHYIKAIDSGLFNTIQFGKNFGFQPEFDVQCEQLGKVEPFKALAIKQKTADAAKSSGKNPTAFDGVNFYFDEDTFDLIFNDRDDALFSMVYALDETYFEEEAYYFCADSLSLPAFLEFSKTYEIEPQESAAETFNSIVSIFTKLGFSFKLDGAIVAGWPSNLASRDLGRNLRYYDLGIPGYSVNELVGLSKSPSYCSSFSLSSVYNDDVDLLQNDIQTAQLYSEVGTRPSGSDTLWQLATTTRTDLNTAEATILTHGTRLTTAEGSITSQGSRLTTAEGSITTQGTRLTTAEGTISTQGTRLTAAETTIASQGLRLSTAEIDIGLIETDLTAAELDIVAIEADIGTVGATSLQGQITALDARVVALEI